MRRRSVPIFLAAAIASTEAFMAPQSSSVLKVTIPTTTTKTSTATMLGSHEQHEKISNALTSTLVATSIMIASFGSSFNVQPVYAYDASDYASETVQEAVKALKDSAGNNDATFKVYEDIAGIITEGKGVGGMVNYKGVQLERGYVADEDTSIYNPGLTLLTESEKERLVDSIIQSRKAGLSAGQWSENNEYGYEFLKGSLDPLHMNELSGYLRFVPVYGALLYLGVLAVQQNVRSLFTTAYIAGVVAFFAPIIALVAVGAQ